MAAVAIKAHHTLNMKLTNVKGHKNKATYNL